MVFVIDQVALLNFIWFQFQLMSSIKGSTANKFRHA